MRLRNKKTGEIGELSGVNRIIVYEPEMPLCGNSILGEYDTLAKLNEEWEDYEPAEPLIKDPKIRKAVRAWAEANDYPKTMELYYNAPNFVLRSDISTIEFDKEIEPLQHGEQHTIEELCGSEEIEILEPAYTTIEEKEMLKGKNKCSISYRK